MTESTITPDLTPRPVGPAGTPRRQRRWGAIALIVGLLAVGGVVVTKFLTDAINYYCSVDELGTKSGCEAGTAIRLEGSVKEGSKSIDKASNLTTFQLTKNRVDVLVRYNGLPSTDLFQDCIDVVVPGVYDASRKVFEASDLIVKHNEKYQSADAVEQKQERDAACSLQR